MRDKVFVDTNVFVYAYSDDDILKHKVAKNLLQNELSEDFVIVSTQILNEFYSVMSKSKLSHQEIANYVKEITNQAYVKPVTMESVELCLKIKEKYRFSWWDSLVLTSALENECSVLYSEDLQNGQIIEHSLKIINIFT